jgi:hypothetical protein
MYVGSGSVSVRMSRSIDSAQSRKLGKDRGIPTRGNAWNSGVRADASPVSRPCQYGELAERASSSGRCTRIRLATRIATSGSGSPTCTCSANVGSRRASARTDPITAWWRAPGATTISSHTANGWVPATAAASRRPCSTLAMSRRSSESSATAPSTCECTPVVSSTAAECVSDVTFP